MKQVPMTELVTIYHTMEYAPEFFKALAEIERPHPTTDIDRRRRDIIARTKKPMLKATAEAIFARFSALGLGKLEAHKGPATNSKFHWNDGIHYASMAQEVIAAAKSVSGGGAAPKSVSHTGSNTYVFKLSSGPMLKLSPRDIAELREFLRAID